MLSQVLSQEKESFFLEKHEENLNYIKDHNNIIQSQMNQLKQITENTQTQIEEEKNLRKMNNDKILKDIINYIENKYEEKFQIMEKNLLETEKNLVNMNKDYIKSFQGILSKQKDANELELQNLKNMIELGLKNNQNIYDKDIDEMKKLMTEVKGDLNESKRSIEKIEGFVNDNMKIMKEYRINGDKSLEGFNTKIKKIEQDAIKSYEETRKNIEKKMENSLNKFNERIEKYENNISDLLKAKLHPYDSYIKDGEHLFRSSPMNFKDAEGNMPEYWTKLFDYLGQKVPQGMDGTNPQSMSEAPVLEKVKLFKSR